MSEDKKNIKEEIRKKVKGSKEIYKKEVLLEDWVSEGLELSDFMPKDQQNVPLDFLTWKMAIKMANSSLKDEFKKTHRLTMKTPAKEALVRIMEAMSSSFL